MATPAAGSRIEVKAYDAYWSADGRVVAFWDGNRLWMMNADGSGRTPLAPFTGYGLGGASLSPTAQLVGITDSPGRGGTLVVKRAGGNVVKRYRWRTDPVEGFYEPVWAPNGRAVAIAGEICEGGDRNTLCIDISRIFVADFREKGVRRVSRINLSEDSDPVWSPNGKRIAFRTATQIRRKDSVDFSAWRIALMRPNGAHRTVVTPRFDVGCCSALAWSPGGRAIAFTRRFGPEGPSRTVPPPQRFGIYVARIASRRVHRVAATPMIEASFVHVAWSPDGRQLAFADTRGISVIEIAARRQRLVTKLGKLSRVSWTPSRRILFTHSGAIYTVVPGGRPRRLAP